MASKHLDAPLDYLYESLPDAEMMEARRHLAECPQCREDIAMIRETVKFYRRDPRPRPPPGLAGRTAAALSAIGAAAAEPAVPPSGGSPDGTDAGSQLNAAATEAREESPSGKWFFHPAWPVAASVMLIFVILYHVSPRRPQWSGDVAHMSAAAGPAAARGAVDRERQWVPLPESPPRADADPPPAPVLGKMKGVSDAPSFADPRIFHIPDRRDVKNEPRQSGSAHPDEREVLGDSPKEPERQILRELPGENISASELEALDAIADAIPAGESVVVNLPPGMEPPRLAPRPPEIDVEKLTRELIFMTGMRLGHGELSEAGATIDLLRRYDPEKALELDRILGAMLKEQEPADTKEPVPDPETTRTEPSAARSGTPDKYFFAPGRDAGPPDRPEPSVEPEGPVADASPGMIGEAGAAPDSAEQGTVIPDPEIVSISAEFPAAGAETASPPAGFVHGGDGVPAPGAVIETPPPPASEPEPAVEAPDVPKSSPDALPPTLGESAADSPPSAILPEHGSERRIFTTDPYYRDRRTD